MNSTPKSVVTFSGGMDSATLLYFLVKQKHEVMALGVDYGQRHRVELKHAEHIARDLNVPYEVADLRGIVKLLGGSSQTDPAVPVPLGHYAEESMKQTVVPNRNMIILAIASAWAISAKADYVAYAAHAGDHTIYPDCRPLFANKLAEAINLADWHQVELLRPFVDKTKAKIASLGGDLGVPFKLTWSCYQGGDKHCGACGTCIERREAFLMSGLDDPTEYKSTAPEMKLDTNGSASVDWDHTIRGNAMPTTLRRWVQSIV